MAEPGEQTKASDPVVLIHVDGTPCSERAVEWYLDHLKNDHDKLIISNILEPVCGEVGYILAVPIPPVTSPSFLSEERTKDSESCQKFVEQAKAKNLTDALARSRFSAKPGLAIIDNSEDYDVAIIIMGTRGHGMLRSTFLGSVSEYVLHHAHKPLVLLPPPKKHQQ